METSLVGKRPTLMHRVCDNCHSRKVRCDRQNPCGNCQDQNTVCTHHRRMVRSERKASRPRKGASSANASIELSFTQSLSKADSSHGPDVSLPSTLHDDVLLFETRETTECSNSIEVCSYPGSLLDMTPYMGEANTSEGQQKLFAQLRDLTATTMVDWILEENGPETIRNLYPSLREERQQPHPIQGPNDAETLGQCSGYEPHGVGMDSMSSSDYLQVHNYFADARSSDMDHILFDDFESLAAITEFEHNIEDPQNQLTGSQILNSRLPSTGQHRKRDYSFIPDWDQIVTLAATKCMQNIPDTEHACHCRKELTYILEKLELKDHTLEPREQSYVELALSFQRQAVEKCTTMIACNCCPLSTDRMMLLGLIVEKLVMAFKDLIRVCQEEGLFETLSYHHPNSCHDQPTPSWVRSQDSASIPSSHFLNNTNTERRLFLGDYEVCSSEWAPLVKTLIRLYAKKLKSLLSYCKMWATAANQSAMLAIFSNAEQLFEIVSAIL